MEYRAFPDEHGDEFDAFMRYAFAPTAGPYDPEEADDHDTIADTRRLVGGDHPVAVLSGSLLGPAVDDDTASHRYAGDLAGTPALVAGGGDDDRLAPERIRATASVLRDLGADVTERVYDGVGHEVTDEEFAWLDGVLRGILDDPAGDSGR